MFQYVKSTQEHLFGELGLIFQGRAGTAGLKVGVCEQHFRKPPPEVYKKAAFESSK